MSILYDIQHRTAYGYSFPVTLSHHVAHLLPRTCGRQRCLDAILAMTPQAAVRHDRQDFFGNPLTLFTVDQGHESLSILVKSRVEVFEQALPNPETTPAWEEVAALLAAPTPTLRFADGGFCPLEDGAAAINPDDLIEAVGFVHASPLVPLLPELRQLAELCFPPGTPVLAGAITLTRLIFERFTYDPVATEIDTPLREVTLSARGVCQDFAHVMIGALRSLGLAARYVSGYLLTGNGVVPDGVEQGAGWTIESPDTDDSTGGKSGQQAEDMLAPLSLGFANQMQRQADPKTQPVAKASGAEQAGEPGEAIEGTPAAHVDSETGLIGADATHAWVSLWVPGHGWIDLDPTNNKFALVEHISTAWGRDFEDVSPIKGVMVGGGEHTITVEVSVRPSDGVMPPPVPQLSGPDLPAWPPAEHLETSEGLETQGTKECQL